MKSFVKGIEKENVWYKSPKCVLIEFDVEQNIPTTACLSRVRLLIYYYIYE